MYKYTNYCTHECKYSNVFLHALIGSGTSFEAAQVLFFYNERILNFCLLQSRHVPFLWCAPIRSAHSAQCHFPQINGVRGFSPDKRWVWLRVGELGSRLLNRKTAICTKAFKWEKLTRIFLMVVFDRLVLFVSFIGKYNLFQLMNSKKK